MQSECPKPKRCKHCGKSGHVASDCWEKHPDKRPSKNTKDTGAALARSLFHPKEREKARAKARARAKERKEASGESLRMKMKSVKRGRLGWKFMWHKTSDALPVVQWELSGAMLHVSSDCRQHLRDFCLGSQRAVEGTAGAPTRVGAALQQPTRTLAKSTSMLRKAFAIMRPGYCSAAAITPLTGGNETPVHEVSSLDPHAG